MKQISLPLQVSGKNVDAAKTMYRSPKQKHKIIYTFLLTLTTVKSAIVPVYSFNRHCSKLSWCRRVNPSVRINPRTPGVNVWELI